MNLIYSILIGKFNFITPISFMIMGILISAIAFTVRYTIYIKRKKYYADSKDFSAAEGVK